HGGFEEVETVVEFVVADGAALIAQRVHGGDGGVDIVGVDAALISDVIAHRAALDGVAIVEQDGVAGFGADLLDDRGGAGKAECVVLIVGVIVVGDDVDVDVGGF